MVRLFVSLMLAVLCIKNVQSFCDDHTLNAIRKLRADQDDSDILQQLSGDYTVTWVNEGIFNSFASQQCIAITYGKTDKGYTAQYKGATTGTYYLTYNNGVLQLIDNAGEVQLQSYIVYKSDDGKVLGVYTCSSSFFASTTSSIAVLTSDLSSSLDLIQAAKDNFKSLGIGNGVDLPACS